MDIPALEERARGIRTDIVRMVYEAGCGHPGGSLSAVELLCALYYNLMNVNPERPGDDARDRLVYSKGHACPVLYAILADLGFFPKDELDGFRKLDRLLQGHADASIPGVEMSAGSLGMGLSFAHGIALARDIDGKDYRVFAFLGDGENQEGQVWEAAMSIGFRQTRKLVAIVDQNQIQNDDFVKVTKDLEPLEQKWRSFNWGVEVIDDGHDFTQVLAGLERALAVDGPVVVIAKTRKGHGVSFMELNPKFHGMAPTADEYQRAMEELRG